MRTYEGRRLPTVWRWVGIALRALHLAAVVALGAALLGAPPRLSPPLVGATLLATGVVLFALDQWKSRDHWRQAAGLAALAKLGLIAWMMTDAQRAEAVFWAIVLWSVVFAHAPAGLRHFRFDAAGRRAGA